MSKAMLVYIDKITSNMITLESGSLFYIDQLTKGYTDLSVLKKSFMYASKIESLSQEDGFGEIKLLRIKDLATKEELPVLINDNRIIYTRDNYYENKKSEVENSRKLLFNSKNKMFIKMVLNNRNLRKTMGFSMNISLQEYEYAIKKGIPVYISDEKYRVNVIDLFTYISQNQKYGIIRNVFEDSLDIWKNKLMSLDEIELYYYSRSLRIIQNEYYKNIKKVIDIKNLNLRNEKLIPFLINGDKNYYTNTLKNVKIKKIAA